MSCLCSQFYRCQNATELDMYDERKEMTGKEQAYGAKIRQALFQNYIFLIFLSREKAFEYEVGVLATQDSVSLNWKETFPKATGRQVFH